MYTEISNFLKYCFNLNLFDDSFNPGLLERNLN